MQIAISVSILDDLRADFALAPLPGEPSCQEGLHPFNPEARLKEGEIFRYRSLCCPINSFRLSTQVRPGNCHVVHDFRVCVTKIK
ncbi:MAG: hypothetical protein ACYDHX_09760 [Methanothrix sp.]